MGVVPGAILGAGVAIFLSKLLAEGSIDLLAPQANAFATFTIIIAEGQGDWYALGLGFMLGAFVEWATGMGTSFGLGMYLPTVATFPMLIGGAARDWWENRRLLPKIEKIRVKEGSEKAEKSRALMLLFTFMIAAGALTGEAFFGVESAILAVADEVEVEQTYYESSWMDDTYLDEMLGTDDFNEVILYAESNPECSEISLDEVTCQSTLSMKSWWPYGRMAIFAMVNLSLGVMIYVLFSRAGIIGVQEKEVSDDDIMDAELAE